MNSRDLATLLIGATLGAAVAGILFYVIKRRSRASPAAQRPSSYPTARPLMLKPRSQPARVPAGTYENAEEWDITWNREGLPTKVVIHRNATRT